MNPSQEVRIPKIQCRYILKGHQRPISCVKFSRNRKFLASSSGDEFIAIWNLKTIFEKYTTNDTLSPIEIQIEQLSSDFLLQLRGHKAGVSDVDWSIEDKYLCSASDDTTIKIWNAQTGECLKTLTGHINFVYCCSFNRFSNIIASGSQDESIRVFDVKIGKSLHVLPAHSNPVSSVSFSMDGSLLATGSYDGLIRIWDLEAGTCLKTLVEESNKPVGHIKFSPNGKYILASTFDNKIMLWDYNNAKLLKTFEGHKNIRYCIATTFLVLKRNEQYTNGHHTNGNNSSPIYSTSDVYIISGSEDGVVFCWELQSKEIVAKLEGHTNIVEAVDCNIQFESVVIKKKKENKWKTKTSNEEQKQQLNEEDSTVYIASGSHDLTIRLWSVE